MFRRQAGHVLGTAKMDMDVPVAPGEPVMALPVQNPTLTMTVGLHYRHDDMTGALRVFVGSFKAVG